MKWKPIEAAPKDGTPILVKFKKDLSEYSETLKTWEGRCAVMNNRNNAGNWSFAAPVGQGGFPDAWFEGWKLLEEV